jgi:hypothetical protein
MENLQEIRKINSEIIDLKIVELGNLISKIRKEDPEWKIGLRISFVEMTSEGINHSSTLQGEFDTLTTALYCQIMEDDEDFLPFIELALKSKKESISK